MEREDDPAPVRVLKSDALGRVELIEGGGTRLVRRVACGSRAPLSAWLARRLLARERAALRELEGLEGIPGLAQATLENEAGILVREHVEGQPLHLATALPEDFFERLAQLVERVHARGVCHNDLHKEQNVIVTESGLPALIDFQLASVHRRRGRTFQSRVHDDLRHVEKHLRRYTKQGRGPASRSPSEGAPRRRRSLLAGVWRRSAKPLYNLVTRRLLNLRDGEARRSSKGPWPAWTPPVGGREGTGD